MGKHAVGERPRAVLGFLGVIAMPLRPPLVASLTAFVLTTGVASCGGEAPPPRSAAERPGLAYAGRLTTLFDDGIDAQAIGYTLEPTTSPEEDDLLRERTQLGDCVARVRVVSVTSTRDDRGKSWQLGLHTLERLAGCASDGGDFTLEVKDQGPAAGVMRTFDGRLMGASFLAFVRAFARPGGTDVENHFHLAAQGQEEVDAARVAALFSR
jgi:hypothetical protein